MVDSGVLGPLSVEGLLTGSMLDGTDIFGSDSLRIVPHHGLGDKHMGRANRRDDLGLVANIASTSLVLDGVTAVPEPPSIVLAVIALAGIVAVIRHRTVR